MKASPAWLMIVANFLGGILFLVGAVRFYTIDDIVGTIVFALAGCIAIVLAVLNLLRLKKTSS